MRFLFSVFAIAAALLQGSQETAVAAVTESTSSVQSNMNPLPYKIANSDGYAADFGQAEYFEVYTSLIRTRYSEVYWKTQDPVALPDAIRRRFENRTMAVVGYEVDQVHDEKDANGGDVSVPITYTYNHHYNAWLLNAREASIFQRTDRHKHNNDTGMPLVQTFSSGNGGEFRMSYKGFPKGYAQLIDSPDTFRITVMAVDTWNREAMVNNAPKFVAGPLPKSTKSRFPINSTVSDLETSPLAECPCNDRVVKEGGMSYQLVDDDDMCAAPVEGVEECTAAVTKLVQSSQPHLMHVIKANSEVNFHVPQGCSVEHRRDGTTHAYWREGEEEGPASSTFSTVSDSSGDTPSNQLIATAASYQVNLTMELDATTDRAKMYLTGPADRWFAVAFGTHNMCLRLRSDQCPDGGPNAVIVSGDDVLERVLDYHGTGRLVETTWSVESNTVTGGNRTAILIRSLDGKTEDHFSFDFAELATVPSTIPIITARGCSQTFAQHCGHQPATLNFLPVDNDTDRLLTPICRNGISGTINGAEFERTGFRSRCAEFPRGDLAQQHNPTCTIESYVGGFLCCRDGHSLLDSDQEIPWEAEFLEYRLKFRFYFEDYCNETSIPNAISSNNTFMAVATEKPSHKNLLNFVWMTESNAQEYDTPVCPEGTQPSQCLHMITSRFQVRDMIRDCPTRPDATICSGTNASQAKGIKLIYASAHCHAGSCHSMELYNADTGILLCKVLPIVGQSDTEIFNERGYIALPPCLFSDNKENGEGLWMPEEVAMNTTLLSIKRVNTTFGHVGEMAMWQMRGVLVPQDPSELPPSDDFDDDRDLEPHDGGDDDGMAPDPGASIKTTTVIYVAVFGAWMIACFFLSMYVWSLAFKPRVPGVVPHFCLDYDLILAEEAGLV